MPPKKRPAVRVRYAPSPTGRTHIGNLRTALYNRLFATRMGGTFYVRIEDTDRARLVPGAVEGMLRTLEALGIRHDEGPFLKEGRIVERGPHAPYEQSKRLTLYREHADRLLAEGKAYRCFCSPEELTAMRERGAALRDHRCRGLSPEGRAVEEAAGRPSVVRLVAPRDGTTAFTDVIRGEIRFPNAEIDDAVLLKSDGYPTYHLANVVDDRLMGTTHVIRGEEWIPSTPKHVLLYAAFGWQPPAFAHLPLLLNADRSKLSKRQGDVAIEDFLAKGYLPEALVNFTALLGWNPRGDQEIYGLDELAESFAIGKVNATGAVVNFEKLDWLNRHYLRELTAEEFARRAAPFLERAGLITPATAAGEWVAQATGRRFRAADLAAVVGLERERVSALAELPDALGFAFRPVEAPAAMLPWKGTDLGRTAELLTALRAFLSAQERFAPDALETATKEWVAENGFGNGAVLWPMRVALTGREASPGPFAVAAALGKEETLDRIDHAIRTLTA